MTAALEAMPAAKPWWRIAWYPAVFPAAIIVQAWDAAFIHPAALYRPLLLAVAATLLVTLAMSALCRNRDLGALAAMAIVLLVMAAALPMAALVLLLTAGLIVAVGLSKRGRPWPIGEKVTRLMSVVATIVLLAVGISLLQSGALARGAGEIAKDAEGRGPVGVAAPEAPDIYLILLDGYPGTKARALDPSYPPSDLASRLASRGFDMAPVTHSNYLQTTTTVSSLLQMRHLAGLPELAGPWGPEPKDVQRLRMLLNDAPGIAALRGLGYRSVATASGFAEVELRRVDRLDRAGPADRVRGQPRPRHGPRPHPRDGRARPAVRAAARPDPRLVQRRLGSRSRDARRAQVRLRASPGAPSAVGLRAVGRAAPGECVHLLQRFGPGPTGRPQHRAPPGAGSDRVHR